MAENQTLRNLLRSLASFIGDGAGGLLPKLGWKPGEFNDFINKSETDTAWEGYHRRKKGDAETSNMASASISQAQKRSFDGDHSTGLSKKPRNGDNEIDNNQNGFSLLVPTPTNAIPPPPLYPGPPRSQDRNSMLSDFMKGSNGSPTFMRSSVNTNSAQYSSAGGSNIDGFSTQYLPGVNINMEQRVSSSYDSSSGSVAQHRVQQTNEGVGSDEVEIEDDPKTDEAYKLIQCVLPLCFGIALTYFLATILKTTNEILHIVFLRLCDLPWCKGEQHAPYQIPYLTFKPFLLQNDPSWSAVELLLN